jgi:hypothetical protein
MAGHGEVVRTGHGRPWRRKTGIRLISVARGYVTWLSGCASMRQAWWLKDSGKDGLVVVNLFGKWGFASDDTKERKRETLAAWALIDKGNARASDNSCLGLPLQAAACPRVEKRREGQRRTPQRAGR